MTWLLIKNILVDSTIFSNQNLQCGIKCRAVNGEVMRPFCLTKAHAAAY